MATYDSVPVEFESSWQREPLGFSEARSRSPGHLMVDQEEDRVVHDLWSGQDRVRCVCHADRRIAAIAPSLEAAGQRTDPFDAAASQDQRHRALEASLGQVQ